MAVTNEQGGVDIGERARRLAQLAVRDLETGLNNRLGLEQALIDLELTTPCAVIFAALAVAPGHVQQVGVRLARIESDWLVGRLGHDLIGVAGAAADPEIGAARIAAAQAGLAAEGIASAAGYATYPANAADAPSLIAHAEIALAKARAAHMSFAAYDRVESAGADAALMADLLHGIDEGQVTLVHQPKLDLQTGGVAGVEALLRWTHPARGAISPDVFVPIAEDTGAIRALTEWTLARAVADAETLTASGRELSIAVNISARLLGDADFARFAIERAGRAKLCFEITETAMIENPALAARLLSDFAAAGIEISIDDFGARLSSFGYLQRVAAQELKIDKGFLVPFAAGDERLIVGAIELAHVMGLSVTVEGVESRAVLERLAAIGADKAQGNIIAPPLTLSELRAFLARY